MLQGYFDFFMDPSLADCYLKVKEELDKLVQKKVMLENDYKIVIPDFLAIHTEP